jgi:serine/threonine-protein kinase HipA
MRDRTALIKLDGIRVGVLREIRTGVTFSYDQDYLQRGDAVPVSLTLPLRPEPFETERGIHPFFLNLLPEGWLLDISLMKLKIAKDDAFGLLLAACADCIGAVEVTPLEERTVSIEP